MLSYISPVSFYTTPETTKDLQSLPRIADDTEHYRADELIFWLVSRGILTMSSGHGTNTWCVSFEPRGLVGMELTANHASLAEALGIVISKCFE